MAVSQQRAGQRKDKNIPLHIRGFQPQLLQPRRDFKLEVMGEDGQVHFEAS